MRGLVGIWLLSICVILVPCARADGLREYLSGVSPLGEIVVKPESDARLQRVSFTSQVWRGEAWKHDLIITEPQVLQRADFVVILLTGGEGGESQRRGAREYADALGVRTAILTKVPNQPLFGGKTEDDLLSYSLDQYRRSGDGTWPLLFPMVASVVRGIDAFEKAVQQRELKVVVVGASKRGWTTYLASAVDKRIVAMVPAVFEMVSMNKQIELARERYGKDSEKIRAYTQLGLTDSFSDPRVSRMVSWIDPIEYAPSFTMPKLVLLGSNDPYWVVDSAKEYWSKLPGPKALRILPNVGHGVLGERAASEAIVRFLKTVMASRTLPTFEWRFSSPVQGRALVMGDSSQRIVQCALWRATSADTDFRDSTFTRTECEVLDGRRTFKGVITTTSSENVAAFADIEVEGDAGSEPLALSTEPHVYLAQRTP